jgi:hemoglobin-like flavoprotein
MTPQQLRVVRNFFARNGKHIDAIVANTFRDLLAQAPEGAKLMSAALEGHQQGFTAMFRKVIELTRAAHLWPVTAFTGRAAIPGLGALRTRHKELGVTTAHFGIMKAAMLQAMEQAAPEDFNAELAGAFADLFDVLEQSLTGDEGQADQSAVELETLLARHTTVAPGGANEFPMGPVAAE